HRDLEIARPSAEDFSQRRRYYLDVLETATETVGDLHSISVNPVTGLAKLYDDNGQHADAAEKYELVIAQYRYSNNQDHPAYSSTLDRCADLYSGMGRHTDAAQLYKELIAWYKS